MRKIILPLVASLALATPALANEARVEARGGAVWGQGDTEAVVGAAAGYDFDLGDTLFAGAEVSGDKILTAGANRVAFGFTGRFGGKIGTATKAFVAAGYTTKFCTFCQGALNIGGGVEYNFARNLYAKVEYRHFESKNQGALESAAAGLGMRF